MGVRRKYLNDYIFTCGNCWCHRPTPSVGWLGSCDSWQQCSMEKPGFTSRRIDALLSMAGRAREPWLEWQALEPASLNFTLTRGLELWKSPLAQSYYLFSPHIFLVSTLRPSSFLIKVFMPPYSAVCPTSPAVFFMSNFCPVHFANFQSWNEPYFQFCWNI